MFAHPGNAVVDHEAPWGPATSATSLASLHTGQAMCGLPGSGRPSGSDQMMDGLYMARTGPSSSSEQPQPALRKDSPEALVERGQAPAYEILDMVPAATVPSGEEAGQRP